MSADASVDVAPTLADGMVDATIKEPEIPPTKKSRALTPAERKRLSRASQSAEKKSLELEKNRNRDKKNRAAQYSEGKLSNSSKKTEEEQEEARIKKRDLQAKRRAAMSEGEKEEARIKNAAEQARRRKAMTEEEKDEALNANAAEHRIRRAAQTEEERKFAQIKQKHSMRIMRKEQTGKEHLLKNLEAKRGMKVFNEQGRLKDFAPRSHTNHGDKRWDKDLNDWNVFRKEKKSQAGLLEEKRPDIVCQLNEQSRKIREADRNKREKEEESQEKYEELLDSLENEEQFCYEAPTEEETKLYREQDIEDWKCYFDERKKEEKEEEKMKKEEKKRAQIEPLDPLPERPLCEYEKIREINIKEREDAMTAAGFFSDLQAFKKSFGK